MEEALKLLGLGTPFVYAGSVFAAFNYLDERASNEAKTQISIWMKPIPSDKAAVGAAIVDVFDRIYGRPLLSIRAFTRSMVISLIVSFLFVVEFHPYALTWLGSELGASLIFAVLLASNIVSDYASLFVVRRWLVIASRRPMLALLAGAIVGSMIVLIIMSVARAMAYAMFFEAGSVWMVVWSSLVNMVDDISWRIIDFTSALALAALAVHGWLLLFAVGVVGVQALNLLMRLAGKTQWFLKEGSEHPLQAIGYVAAGTVFVVAAIGRWLLA